MGPLRSRAVRIRGAACQAGRDLQIGRHDNSRRVAFTMLALFGFTLFLSSVLLFLVQPMIAKMVLPMLGGTPAVWNTCMVFFQAMLLGGYLYVHAATRWLTTRQQVLLHITLLSAS